MPTATAAVWDLHWEDTYLTLLLVDGVSNGRSRNPFRAPIKHKSREVKVLEECPMLPLVQRVEKSVVCAVCVCMCVLKLTKVPELLSGVGWGVFGG